VRRRRRPAGIQIVESPRAGGHAPSQRNPNSEARGEEEEVSNIIVFERQDGGVEMENFFDNA